MVAAASIFIGTYLVLALGRLPGFRVDRTGAAIIGASLMIAFNILTLDEAYASIDHNTIILLFGMMIVVANLRLSGFFTAVSEWMVEHAHHPLTLLAAIVLVSGVFSAFFVNDTMANLIVIQKARRQAAISFWEYFRVGLPLTVITITVGVLLL